MKIFNKGARSFKFYGKDIAPDQFTDLTETIGGDDKRATQAAALLKDYPNELLAGENASADAKAAIGRAAVLEKENATLKGQVEKLQKLLVSTDATASETETETALLERAEKAEARILELEKLLESCDNERSGAVKAAYGYQDTIRTLEAQIEALTAPPAAPAQEAPTPAPKGKKGRNIDTASGS